jgi:Tfp pilus assembly protein PilO
MNKISKEKRNQLIVTVLGLVLIIAGLWYFLIRAQQEGIAKLTAQKAEKEKRLHEIRETFKNKDKLAADLAAVTRKLDAQEQEMAAGDLYSWTVSAIRKFKQPYKVEIPQVMLPTVSDMSLLPKFPYKQATTSVLGTAYYHDLGKFIADFENQYSSARIQNLTLIPATAASPGEQEKLSFKMDIVWLVKPGTSRLASNP